MTYSSRLAIACAILFLAGATDASAQVFRQREVPRLPNGSCPQGTRVIITNTPGGGQEVHCVLP